MNVGLEDDIPPPPPRPRTMTVASVLLGAAALVSWLAAYALPNALVAADLMAAWPAGSDPRPRWLLISFLLLAGLFSGMALLFQWTSRRHLRNIEAPSDSQDPDFPSATG